MEIKINKHIVKILKWIVALTSSVGTMSLLFITLAVNKHGENPLISTLKFSVNTNGLFKTILIVGMFVVTVEIWSKVIYNELP